MRDWPARLREALDDGGPASLVSILATEGSAPREAGTRMIVTDDRIAGTIGGGNLEFQAVVQARAMLALPAGAWRVQDYPLGPLLGQCCGGRVRLLIEHVDAAARDWIRALEMRSGPVRLHSRLEPDRVVRSVVPDEGPLAMAPARGARPVEGAILTEVIGGDETPVLLFGGGHVGVALANMLGRLPFALTWLDVREELDPAVRIVPETALLAHATAAARESLLLIMTHDHGLDYRLLKAALAGEAGFVGVIGSMTKRARFLSRLRRDGFGAGDCARMVCPIGADGVTGKEPEVIAVAVAAQLLALRAAAAASARSPRAVTA